MPDQTSPRLNATARGVYNLYKTNAEKRNYSFELTESQFLKLTQSDCYLCGDSPGQLRGGNFKDFKEFRYNGIDRVDNRKGYIQGNVEACCKICNIIKQQLSLKELALHIGKMLRGILNRTIGGVNNGEIV